jgi:hypothetical protein
VRLYQDRYHLVQQRLKRNRIFRPARFAGLGGGEGSSECELSELKSMLGVTGETRYVMGFLTQASRGGGQARKRGSLAQRVRGQPAPTCWLKPLLVGRPPELLAVACCLSFGARGTGPVQPEEGRYALEDMSARLPVDLSDAEQTMGVFTQNCLVVAQGELQASGVFKVGRGRRGPGVWTAAGGTRQAAHASHAAACDA